MMRKESGEALGPLVRELLQERLPPPRSDFRELAWREFQRALDPASRPRGLPRRRILAAAGGSNP